MTEVSASTHQRLAVAALIRECELLCESGNLAPSKELSLRFFVAHTLMAFGMPSKAERAA